jgi:hypothetical protein
MPAFHHVKLSSLLLKQQQNATALRAHVAEVEIGYEVQISLTQEAELQYVEMQLKYPHQEQLVQLDK